MFVLQQRVLWFNVVVALTAALTSIHRRHHAWTTATVRRTSRGAALTAYQRPDSNNENRSDSSSSVNVNVTTVPKKDRKEEEALAWPLDMDEFDHPNHRRRRPPSTTNDVAKNDTNTTASSLPLSQQVSALLQRNYDLAHLERNERQEHAASANNASSTNGTHAESLTKMLSRSSIHNTSNSNNRTNTTAYSSSALSSQSLQRVQSLSQKMTALAAQFDYHVSSLGTELDDATHQLVLARSDRNQLLATIAQLRKDNGKLRDQWQRHKQRHDQMERLLQDQERRLEHYHTSIRALLWALIQMVLRRVVHAVTWTFPKVFRMLVPVGRRRETKELPPMEHGEEKRSLDTTA